MKTTIITFAFLMPLICFSQRTKSDLWKGMDKQAEPFNSIALKIWNFAEVGYHEEKSAALLAETLEQAGFKIARGVAEIPTAFTAEFGSGKPVVGILGEYDALPGISQEAVSEKKPIPGKEAGHACGHHLFGTASAAAAISVKNWMVANKIKGTLRFYGTPAEEGGSGKVYMVQAGLFNDADVVFHWHPGSKNSAKLRSSLANKTGKFRFYGIASHAAGSPEKGRSALDAVEAMNFMTNLMREHVEEDSRIHYVITKGGEAPNVVPAFAEVYCYIRHPKRTEVNAMWERLVNNAKGAALGTDTRMEYEVIGGVYEILVNKPLAAAMNENLKSVGGFALTADEKEFGRKIQTTLSNPPPLESTASIEDFNSPSDENYGSTDVADVSWVVPTAGLSTATWVPGTPAHSWQAVAAGGMSIGIKGMNVASKVLAGVMVDAFTKPALIASAKREFEAKRGSNFTYKPMLGDRKPALNYRD